MNATLKCILKCTMDFFIKYKYLENQKKKKSRNKQNHGANSLIDYHTPKIKEIGPFWKIWFSSDAAVTKCKEILIRETKKTFLSGSRIHRLDNV